MSHLQAMLDPAKDLRPVPKQDLQLDIVQSLRQERLLSDG